MLTGIRLGDNVVWQIDQLETYRRFIEPFAARSMEDKRRLVYVRFAPHAEMLAPDPRVVRCELDPKPGFDQFSRAVHELIEREGRGAMYVFDNISTLAEEWATDEMPANFFQVTCPVLYQLDAVADPAQRRAVCFVESAGLSFFAPRQGMNLPWPRPVLSVEKIGLRNFNAESVVRMKHHDIEERSLALARAVAAKIDADPAHKGVARARETCRRWREKMDSRDLRLWSEVLELPWDEIRRVLLDPSPNGRRLRQSNPFCGILTPRERWRVYREFQRDEAA